MSKLKCRTIGIFFKKKLARYSLLTNIFDKISPPKNSGYTLSKPEPSQWGGWLKWTLFIDMHHTQRYVRHRFFSYNETPVLTSHPSNTQYIDIFMLILLLFNLMNLLVAKVLNLISNFQCLIFLTSFASLPSRTSKCPNGA